MYDVDTTANGGYFALYNEFNDRVEITKTQYESVQHRDRATRTPCVPATW